MNFRFYCLILALVFLSLSCSAGEVPPSPIPPTNTVSPTETNTPVPTETSTSTTIPTDTPEPTFTNTPTLEPTLTPVPTLEPTVTQVALSEPIVYEGSGDDVAILETGYNLILIKIQASDNDGNFVVIPYTAGGSQSTAIVNHIGPYEGWHITPDLAALEISSDSEWVITVYEWSVERMGKEGLIMFNGDSFSDSGDTVLAFAPKVGSEEFTEQLVELKVRNKGDGNFVVRWIVFGSSVDLLVNEIGDYEGTVLIRDTGGIIVVSSEGEWTLDTSSEE